MVSKLLLNRYELLEKIGEGGMGVVYKAKCHLLNRFVAVKILKPGLSNDVDYIAKFKREANSIASLSHPNIVSVHDVGFENNINFIVMEYINGKTLKQLIIENVKLSSENALDIALQIAMALESAHKNNIIHRDIKSDNIMITVDKIVKVTDFGIAKVSDIETITNSDKVTGSVYYFSPEQAKGLSVDCRADIYSLGVVMYEMVTGKVPFEGENFISVAMMHVQEPVFPPKEVIKYIPENINQVILKALEKEPNNRYQTATEMVEILTAIKYDSNFKMNVDNGSMNATVVMMEPVVMPNKKNRFTFKTKKIVIVIASISLVMIIGILGKYLSKVLYEKNTPYEKNGKIDLGISQGQKIIPTIAPPPNKPHTDKPQPDKPQPDKNDKVKKIDDFQH